MANHKSAQKRIKQTAKRTERNRTIKSALRTFVKRVRVAVEQRDAAAANEALTQAVPRVDGAVTKGILHRKTASRLVSRLSRQVHGLQKAA